MIWYGCKYCDKNLSYLFDDQAEDPDDEYDFFDFNRRIEISQDNDAVKKKKCQPWQLYTANNMVQFTNWQ